LKKKGIEANQLSGYFFIAPAMIFFIVFILYPIIYIVQGGLFQWDGVNERIFIGLKNYVEIFLHDRVFKLIIRNSFYWVFLTVFPQMIIGFLLAFIVNHNLRGRNLARAIFYLPAVISPIVIGIVWQRIYNPFSGLISDLGYKLGLPFLALPFLSDPDIAIFSVINVNVWQWTGYSMLMLLAGMQSIPEEIFESSHLEGCSKWQEIRYLVWPMVRGVRMTLILLGVIGALQTFDLVYALTNGGPNNATQMFPTYIYLKAFKLQSMGYGSALSVITVAIALGLSIFQTKVLGTKFSFDD
jgi:raffinose/stachyose/melibiose transport system permease protein